MKLTEEAFHPVTEADRQWLSPLLLASGHDGCEYAFNTLYMWRNLYGTRVAQMDGMGFVSAESEGTVSFLPPLGDDLDKGIAYLREYTRERGIPFVLHGVDELSLAALSPYIVTATEQEEDGDYLYRTTDLADLPGRAYHSKKSHIAAFSRQFSWVYEPLTADNAADALALTKVWCKERGACRDNSVATERCAVRELLGNMERFGVVGGLIRVDGQAVAYTFGSPVNERVFDVQVEKALSAYPGAYAVINREFAARMTEYTYLNRENDMGIEGLRRAKRSYNPSVFLKKFMCEMK